MERCVREEWAGKQVDFSSGIDLVCICVHLLKCSVGSPLQLMHMAAVFVDLWCLNGKQQTTAGCDSLKWKFSWAVLSCSFPVGKNKAMWWEGPCRAFWLDEIWFDFLADVLFCRCSTLHNSTHTQTQALDLYLGSGVRGVCVIWARAVTSQF